MKKAIVLLMLAFISINCNKENECSNGVKDGDEVDIDCGGRCGECPNCLDGIKNYREIGIDCGSNCKPCKNTWEILPASSNTYISQWLIDFIDELNGVKISSYGREAYTTNDGGKTWTAASLPAYPGVAGDQRFTKLHMANSKLGFATEQAVPGWGVEAFLYRTLDGGSSWHLIDSPTTEVVYSYDAIVMVNDQLGFLSLSESNQGFLKHSKIYRTLDGGNSWSLRCNSVQFVFDLIYSESHPFIEIIPFESNLIRAYTQYGIIESKDEGTSWILVEQNTFAPSKIQMLNKDIGFALKSPINGIYDQALYKTTNGGKDWTVITQIADERFGNNAIRDFYFKTPEIGFLFVDGASRSPGYMTKNGGLTYGDIGYIDQFYFTNTIMDYLFISDADYLETDLIYAIGTRGTLFKLKYEE